MSKSILIGTRGSKLALWQAEYTKRKLEEAGQQAELRIIKTKGDRIQHLSFDKIEGKGFFTKELEDALLNGSVDMAVHSMKDMPTSQPEGLVLAGVSYREDPADWLIIRKEKSAPEQLLDLPIQAIVGTSSARRKAQILDLRSDLEVKDIRGNVPTRIQKLADGQFDAILLAAAGINRLGIDLSDFHLVKLSPKEFIPAPAQGVLTYQCLEDNLPVRRILKNLHHSEVSRCTNIERKILKLLEGGCHMPLGAYCTYDPVRKFTVRAAKADTWDAPVKRVKITSSTHYQLSEQVVEALKQE